MLARHGTSLLRISRPHLQNTRRYAISTDDDVRVKLTEGLKTAMKAKDTSKSTLIRSMLAEVYNADKSKQEKQTTPAIQGLIRKAVQRRKDAARQYDAGSRSDLAAKEREEAVLLEEYLPPLMATEDVDRLLQEVISANEIRLSNPAQSSLVVGKVFKAFYAKVDRSTVDSEYLKKKAEEILKANVQ